MVLGKLNIACKRIKLDPYLLTPYTKINSTWTKDLDPRPKTIKLLKENLRENFHDIRFGNDFLDTMPKAKPTKAKVDKWDYTKLYISVYQRK